MDNCDERCLRWICLTVMLLAMAAAADPPPIVFTRLPPPPLVLNDHLDSLKARIKTILVVPTCANSSENFEIQLNARDERDKYIYYANKERVALSACVDLFGPSFRLADQTQLPDVPHEKLFDIGTLTDRELAKIRHLTSVDALLLCAVRDARLHLMYSTNEEGQWTYCYYTEVTIELKLLSTASATYVYSKTLSLNALHFLEADQLVCECPDLSIDSLIRSTISCAGSFLQDPLTVARDYYAAFYPADKKPLIAFYKEYLLAHPRDTACLGSLGWAFYQDGDRADFMETTARAFEMVKTVANPKYTFIVMNYGHVKLMQHDWDAAASLYRRCLAEGDPASTANTMKNDFAELSAGGRLTNDIRIVYKRLFDEDFTGNY
jgi:hypothetical protein